MALFEIIKQNFRRRAVVSFLLSPLIKILKISEKRSFDKVTRDELIVLGKDWDRITHRKNEWKQVSEFINRLNNLKSKRGGDFIEYYISLLGFLLLVEDEIEIRAYNEFIGFIHSFIKEPMLHTIEDFTLNDFQRILLSYTESKKINIEFESSRIIEILNLEESVGMVFDRAFLIGLVEGELPRKPQYNPIFSEKLLKEMGFPTYDLLYSLSKFNFESITCSIDKIHISCFEKDEKGNIFIESPFLRDVRKETKHPKDESIHSFQEWQIRIGEMIHSGMELDEKSLSGNLKEKAHFIKEGIKRLKDDYRLRSIKKTVLSNRKFKDFVNERINALSKRVSAYSLETYTKCPYSFFFSYILHLSELEDPEKGVDRSLKGQVIHSILARFFEKKLTKKMQKNIKKEWEKLKNICSDTIEQMAPGTRDKILLKLELITSHHKSPLYRMLHTEMSENITHTVMDIEWNFTGKEISIDCNGERIGLTGRIDRIDHNKKGFIIFDYKTGSKKNLPSNKNLKEGKSFQLPFYCFAVQQQLGDVSKTAYYVINNKEGSLIEKRDMISDELLTSNICRVWKEIRELNFEPNLKTNCARFCMYSSFCPAH